MTQPKSKQYTSLEAARAAIGFYIVAGKKLEFEGREQKTPLDYSELNNALQEYKEVVPEDVRDQLREFVNVGELEGICKPHL